MHYDKPDNELIKVSLRNRKTKGFSNEYFKSIDKTIDFVDRNKGIHDVYVGLATTINENGAKENLGSRCCIAFDFDSKDYADSNLTFRDIIEIFKSIGLFYHLIVDSGHGFHVYLYIERTNDIERVIKINKEIALKLGADMKAILPTQSLRIPDTYNFKNEEVKKVSTIWTCPNIREYKLEELEKRFSNKNNRYEDLKERKLPLIKSDMFCVTNMLKGVPTGHRNTCLGRIVKYYQQNGYKKEVVKEIIREWNNRCSPPKKINEIESDFNNYWEEDYKLLGCNIKDKRRQSILSCYCDSYNCPYRINGEIRIDSVTEKQYVLDNNYLEDKTMRKLKGYDYLILSVLITNENGLNTSQIQEKLISRINKKMCISKPKLYETLERLVKLGYLDFIENKRRNEPNFYKIKKISNYGKGYTRLLYSASILMINKCITQNEYLIYIFLSRNIQKCRSVTYDDIANSLDIAKPNISRYIKNLEKVGLLQIDKVVNNKGVLCNRYIIIG